MASFRSAGIPPFHDRLVASVIESCRQSLPRQFTMTCVVMFDLCSYFEIQARYNSRAFCIRDQSTVQSVPDIKMLILSSYVV